MEWRVRELACAIYTALAPREPKAYDCMVGVYNIDAVKFSTVIAKCNMNDSHKPKAAGAQPPVQGPAYSTFPRVTTHGPRDKRCFHGKPEDWQRAPAKRTFGEKVK